jgi:sterol 3beta-glucosyltransferase
MRWRSNEARRFGQADSGESLDDWYTMRCCLPLDRVTVQGVSDYHSFSTLVSLDVQLGSHESLSYLPDQIASGDYSGDLPRHPTGTEENLMREVTSPRRSSTMYIDSTLPPRLASSMTGDNSHPAVDAYHNSYNFNVALLNEQAWFAEALDSAVRAASERVFKSGVNRPKFVLDVAGYDCLATDEDTEKPRSNSSSSSEEELQELSEFRKAEKAKLAAKVFGLKEEDDIWRKCNLLRHS